MARNGFVPVETQGQDVERDADDSSMDGDIFDSADDIFDGENEEDSDGEGIFADNTSIFSSANTPSEDHANAITTREMDARRYEDPKPPRVLPAARKVYDARAGFKGPPKAKRILVAKFDNQGQPLVAHFAGNKQLEPYRKPTPKEYETLRTKGKLVKGGIGQVAPDGSVAPAPPPAAPGIPWTKILVGGGAVVAGGLAFYFWKKRKNAASAVVEQVPETPSMPDDEDDESED